MDYLGILFSFFIFFLFWLSKKALKTIYNPVSIFTLLFAVITLLPAINVYGWYPVNSSVYIMCYIGVLSFSIGGFFALNRVNRNSRVKIRSRGKGHAEIRLGLYYALVGIVIVYQVLYSKRVLIMLKEGYTLGAIRYAASLDYALEHGFNRLTPSRLDSIINRRIIKPIINALIPVSIVKSMNSNGRFNKKNLVIMITLCGLETFRTGGRFTLVVCLAEFYVYYLFVKGEIKFTHRQKRIIRWIVGTLVVGLIYFTFMRKGTGALSFIIKEFYIYYGGSLPNLSARFDELIASNRTLGFTLFIPFLEILTRIGSSVFDITPSPLFTQAADIISNLQTRVYISEDQSFNAFVTLFYYFYMDFGYFGVTALSFLYGCLCGATYKKMIKKKDLHSISIYLWIVNGLIYSMVRFQFYSSSYTYSLFIFALLFFGTGKVRISIGNIRL